ncbi:MAG: hypothetical protein RR202_11025 [Bacteroidales bacterium]
MAIPSISSKYFFFGLFICCTTLTGSAQKTDSLFYDFEYAPRLSGWDESDNLSRIFLKPLERAGNATLFYSGGTGDFHDANSSEQVAGYGLFSEAYQRFSPKTMFYGSAGYAGQIEKNRSGSAFLNPDEMPFDIVDMDAANKGTKKLEIYGLSGAISHRLTSRLALGAKLDYQAKNYTRTKDLRHSNKILDLKGSIGVSYQLLPRLIAGVHYRYERYIEGISFDAYGNTDRQYTSLIDFGASFGKSELFSQNGYTAKDKNNPFVNQVHEGGIEIEVPVSTRLNLFNETSFGTGDGYFGKRSSSSIVHTEHDVRRFRNRLLATYRTPKQIHRLEVTAHNQKTTNYENAYRSETSPSGNTIYEYYGQNETGTKTVSAAAVRYTLGWGESGTLPEWEVSLGTSFQHRSVRAVLYPYYREQTVNAHKEEFSVTHHHRIGSFTLSAFAGMGFRKGSGEMASDGVFTTPSSDAGAPKSQHEYLQRNYDYLTTATLLPEAGFRVLRPFRGIRYYLSASYRGEKPIGAATMSGSYHNTNLTIGAYF